MMGIFHENFLMKMIHLNLFLNNPPLQFTFPFGLFMSCILLCYVYNFVTQLFACLFLSIDCELLEGMALIRYLC